MQNVSAFGFETTIKASNTFPAGFTIRAWADDSDPFDSPSIQVADKTMNINGNMVHWSKANPIPINMALIPGSDDDINMSILLEANRVGNGKTSARDIITVTNVYPDGTTVSYVRGIITDGVPSKGVSTAGRMKTKTYSFAFENKV